MKKHSTLMLLVAGTLLVGTACKKKKDDPATTPAPAPAAPAYSVPTTYNSFSYDRNESVIILGMTTELSSQIALGTGSGNTTSPLTASHLKSMLNNTGSPFTNSSYNSSGFQIESNCIAISQPQLESYIDTLVTVSNSGTVASRGVAGVGLTLDATPKRYLLTAHGENYAQILNKTLMCDLVLYQIVSRVANTNLDNATIITNGTKQYTALEHNWDVAFGYWGVPDSFPTVKTGLKLWGSYSNQVDSGLHCNRKVMNAFLKGRAAIHNKDMATVQAQADIIIAQFDVMTAGGIGQELNEIKQSINAGDMVKVVSQLSECKGFVLSMRNNKSPKRIITDTQITALLALFPTNQWDVTLNDLKNINDFIKGVYGFTDDQMKVM